MKLAFFIDNTRSLGGGEYAQFMFARYLAKRGHQVVVFAGDKHFLSPDLSREENLIMRYRFSIPIFKRRIGLGKINSILSKIHEMLILSPFMSSFQPDWIIGYLKESAIKAVRQGKKHDVPIANFVFETPDWMSRELGSLWQEEWSQAKFRNVWKKTKKAYEQSNILIPNSKICGAEFKKWLPKNTVSSPVYPGVEPFTISKSKKEFDIIYIGRLNVLKNIDVIIKAIAQSKKNYSLLVIGSGEEETALKELSAKMGVQTTFAGQVSDLEKWDYLSKSKIMVFPSSFEGFGMPPLEALIAGKQVICSDIPIFHEVYGDQVHYVPVRSATHLAQKIQDVLTGKKKKKILQKNLLKKYSWEKAAADIEFILGGNM